MEISELAAVLFDFLPGVARGSQLAGDTAKARKTFQNFFALWKDADQDLPVLIEAKKDYAALH
jgi:hypothetical protein